MFLSFIMTRRVYWKCKQCYKALQWINRAPPRDKGRYPYVRAHGLFSVLQDRTALLLSHTHAGHLIESLHISRWHRQWAPWWLWASQPHWHDWLAQQMVTRSSVSNTLSYYQIRLAAVGFPWSPMSLRTLLLCELPACCPSKKGVG